MECTQESERLKSLFEEIDRFIKKHDNGKELKHNVGDYNSMRKFNKKLKECSIGELILLGFEGRYLTREHLEFELKKIKDRIPNPWFNPELEGRYS